MNLAEFLLARIDEDEAIARVAEHVDGPESREWRRGGKRYHRFDNDRSESYEAVFAGNWDRILVARDDGSVAAHIARHDPARVLAECEAKRRIVAMHEAEPSYPSGLECSQCSFHEAYEGFNDISEPWPCPTLCLLALPYADHSDYNRAWRP